MPVLLAQAPQFRTQVTLVPIDVRVVGRQGQPMPGLTAADFSVTEDGVPQQIAHFDRVTADGPNWPARTFVLVLGRGRLNQPTKAVEALADFVRSHLLPQDRVVVTMYLRAVGPTTDHARIATLLETYRHGHERIEARLGADQRGPIPWIVSDDTRSAIEALFADGVEPMNLAGSAADNAAVKYNDFNYLRSALHHARTLPGEKHVVMVTEQPFPTPSANENPLNNFWFREATSARATLSFIHAGGMTASSTTSGRWAWSGGINRIQQTGVRQAQAATASQTGGTSSFFQYASTSLQALDRATRSYYVIGYYPTRPVAPDRYRTVTVSVRTAGATVLYRHGFQAVAPPVSASEYRDTATDARLHDGASGLLHPMPATALNPQGVTWQMRLRVTRPAARQLAVAVAFDPWLVAFERRGDRHVAELDLLLIADDSSRTPVGRHRQRVTVALTDAELTRARREWPTFDVVLPIEREAAFVRGALYQFDTDRRAVTQVRVAGR